jgi:hypothetical protein
MIVVASKIDEKLEELMRASLILARRFHGEMMKSGPHPTLEFCAPIFTTFRVLSTMQFSFNHCYADSDQSRICCSTSHSDGRLTKVEFG